MPARRVLRWQTEVVVAAADTKSVETPPPGGVALCLSLPVTLSTDEDDKALLFINTITNKSFRL